MVVEKRRERKLVAKSNAVGERPENVAESPISFPCFRASGGVSVSHSPFHLNMVMVAMVMALMMMPLTMMT